MAPYPLDVDHGDGYVVQQWSHRRQGLQRLLSLIDMTPGGDETEDLIAMLDGYEVG